MLTLLRGAAAGIGAGWAVGPRPGVGTVPAAVPRRPGPLCAADAVRAAAQDAARYAEHDPQGAWYLKYFSAHHEADRPRRLYELFQVTNLHVNLLSTRGLLEPLKLVETWLWRIDIRRLGWSRRQFAQLIYGKGPFAVEPWFHVLGPPDKADERHPLNVHSQKVPLLAPWLPPKEADDLSRVTDSLIPLVRADWFCHRTMVQDGRDGFGYYDFLGLKTRDDWDRLVGLDRAEVVKRFRERAVVVGRSGVAQSGSRQFFAFGAANGRAYVTHDVSVDTFGQRDKNVLDQRFEGLKHNAEEGVGVLPNDLPVFYASNAEGVLQKVVPDTIAGHDKTATTRDDRVRVGTVSCLACHDKAGLKAFRDTVRVPGRPDEVVQDYSPDQAKLDRLRAGYQREVQVLFDADVAAFERAIFDACLMRPVEASEAIRRVFDGYDTQEHVTPAAFARDVGLDEATFLRVLRAKLAAQEGGATTVFPTTLSNLLAKTPEGISRGKEEELIPFVMPILGFPGLLKE